MGYPTKIYTLENDQKYPLIDSEKLILFIITSEKNSMEKPVQKDWLFHFVSSGPLMLILLEQEHERQ